MQPDQAADYVAGILARHEVQFASREDGKGHLIVMGSSATEIHFAHWAEEDCVVNVSAIVLQQVPANQGMRLLKRLNKFNCEGFFSKFYLDEDLNQVRLEYDLLASRLQPDELMNALSVVALEADRVDDLLAQDFGGKTFGQAVQEALESS
ncbi:MAG: YbjN domain-containing protein [Solirubrobacterales bacterium]|nr:YbjN domain-containing protein [Solirubrobacterales bacterium]